MDDDLYYPQQFGLGSLYDLKDPPSPERSRLHPFRSVKNVRGGILRVTTEREPIEAARIGFAIPAPAARD